MNIEDIQHLQRVFDKIHGWSLDGLQPTDIFPRLEQDMIGVVGEIGEAANILKKIRLEINRGMRSEAALEEQLPALKEELVDTFIYLLRLFDLAGVDIAKDYQAKLMKNKERFVKYEQ